MADDVEVAEDEAENGEKEPARVNPIGAAATTLKNPWVVSLLVGICLIGTAIHLWCKHGSAILENPKYRLSADKISINKQPAWIRGDVKLEVIRGSSLHQLTLSNRDLVAKLRDAFSIHTWVREVERVEKFHGGIIVKVTYRRPVAMVEVQSQDGPGLVFVDASGVILPTDNFSENQIANYLRLQVPDIKSGGIYGRPYGDERVHEGAGIADALGASWIKAGLYRIVATEPSGFSGQAEYELHARKQSEVHPSKVLWGCGIGKEKPGEATAAIKVSQLLKYIREKGPLDQSPNAVTIDIRDGTVTTVTPRTAERPTKS